MIGHVTNGWTEVGRANSDVDATAFLSVSVAFAPVFEFAFFLFSRLRLLAEGACKSIHFTHSKKGAHASVRIRQMRTKSRSADPPSSTN